MFNLLSLLKRHLALTACETWSALQQEEGRRGGILTVTNFPKCTFADESRTLSNTAEGLALLPWGGNSTLVWLHSLLSLITRLVSLIEGVCVGGVGGRTLMTYYLKC